MKKLFCLSACFLFIGAIELSLEGMTDQRPHLSRTIESDQIADVLSHVDVGTLVIVDIDGVVQEPIQTLGCDKWAYYEGDKFIELLGDLKKGLEAFRSTWVEVQNKVNVKLVDEKILTVMDELKKRGNLVFGFTARGIDLADRTKEQLGSIGFKFDSSIVGKIKALNPGKLKSGAVLKDDGTVQGKNYLFKHNILFVGIGANKGEILKIFLEDIGVRPSKIVFIDDRQKNITTLKEMCEKEGIDYVGIRYSATDESTKNFDQVISDIQLYCLRLFAGLDPRQNGVLSDEQSANMLEFFKKVIRDGGDLRRTC